MKKNILAYSIISILGVMVLILGGYIVYEKLSIKSVNNEEEKDVSKINKDKDFVYDAEYEKDVDAESYDNNNGNTYYAKDIVVPFINIDSEYANNSNKEIKSIFEEAIKVYNTGVNNKSSYVAECDYEKYSKDNLISIVLTYGAGDSDIVHPKYYTYNIDSKNGKQLSYEDIYTSVGFKKEEIDSKVEEAITEVMKEKTKNIDEKSYPEGTNFETYNSKSIENYKESIKNNSLNYFIKNKELKIVVKLMIPVGTGEFDTVINIK